MCERPKDLRPVGGTKTVGSKNWMRLAWCNMRSNINKIDISEPSRRQLLRWVPAAQPVHDILSTWAVIQQFHYKARAANKLQKTAERNNIKIGWGEQLGREQR